MSCFPELTETFKDPQGASALNVRQKFPTPADVAKAFNRRASGVPYTHGTWPCCIDKAPELAKQSIGITDEARLYGLVLEQGQLIGELREMQKNLDVLENEITAIVEASREGRILMSTGFIGTMMAGSIIATVRQYCQVRESGKAPGFCWLESFADANRNIEGRHDLG